MPNEEDLKRKGSNDQQISLMFNLLKLEELDKIIKKISNKSKNQIFELICQYQKQLELNTKLITKYEEIIAKYEKIIAEYEKIIAEYEEIIAVYEKIIARGAEQIAEYEEIIAEYEEIIAEYEEIIAEYEKIIARGAEQIAEIEEYKATKEEIIKLNIFQLGKLAEEISEIIDNEIQMIDLYEDYEQNTYPEVYLSLYLQDKEWESKYDEIKQVLEQLRIKKEHEEDLIFDTMTKEDEDIFDTDPELKLICENNLKNSDDNPKQKRYRFIESKKPKDKLMQI